MTTTGKGIGAVAAAAHVPGVLAECAHREPDQRLGVALCGLGGLSTNQLAPALGRTRFARLAGVITGTPAKGEAWAAEHGFPMRNVYRYGDMHELADNPGIDVVYVVTPNALHAEQTIQAAEAGKHVLVEKPMATSVEECDAMIAACRDAGVKLAVGYRCQFEPHHLECIRLAREREFGDLKVIEAAFGFLIGDPSQWRLRAGLAGGGAMMDAGIYALQACRYLTGEEPIHVSALETKTDRVKFSEVDESITWQMTFPSGVLATCATSYNARRLDRFRVYAQEGWFGLEPAYRYGGLVGERLDGEPLRFDQIDHFAAEIDDFARCILEDRESKVAGQEGRRDLAVIEAIYRSVQAGCAVDV